MVGEHLSLTKRTTQAALIMLFGHGLSQLIRFGGSLATTRILAPELFGVMAIANAIVMIVTMFSDLGFTLNVVRSKRGEDEDFLKTIFSFKVIQGLALCLLIVIAGFVIDYLILMGNMPEGSTYSNPDLAIALFVVSICPILNGLRSIQIELHVRKQSLGKQMFLDITAQVSALLFIITAGLNNPTIFALAFSNVIAALVVMLGSYVIYERKYFGFSWEKDSIHEIFSFGKWIFGSTIVTGLSNNIDKFLIGYFLNSAQMGVFSIAVLIFNAVGGIFNKLTAPLFSAVSEVIRTRPSDVGAVYYKIRLYLDFLTCLPACFVIVNGGYLIKLLYDDRYARAGEFLQIMCISYLIDCFIYKNQVITAMGNSKVQFQTSVWRLFGVVVMIIIGNHFWGVTGIVLAVALRRIFGSWVLFSIFIEKGLVNWVLELRTVGVIIISMLVAIIGRFFIEFLISAGFIAL